MSLENNNHPLTNGTYDSMDYLEARKYQTTVQTPEPTEYLGEHVESLRQLCESGESDCPWATWEDCVSHDLAAILGVRLQTLCNNRRRINQHGD